MRLEILVGHGPAQIHHLNKASLVIGASQSVDIVLPVSGISRKHVNILKDGDNFYVIDLGSTNGTYINEERIVPGRKVQFTSFFPVRLGDSVILNLLSDDDQLEDLSAFSTPMASPQEVTKTTAIKLTDLQRKGRTEELIKKRSIRPQVKKPIKKNTGSNSILTLLLIFGFLVAGGYYYFEKEKTDEVKEVAPLPVPPMKKPAVVPPPEIPLVSEEDLISKEDFQKLLLDLKCVSEIEKYLCENISGADAEGFGVTQVKSMLNVMVDGTDYLNEAAVILPPPPEDAQPGLLKIHEQELKILGLFVYLIRQLPKDLDYERLKDYYLSFGLFRNERGERKIVIIGTFTPSGLKKFREASLNEEVAKIKNGSQLLKQFKKYFRLYY